MRHGRRGDAAQARSTTTSSASARSPRQLQKAYLETVRGAERALGAVARARPEHDARVSVSAARKIALSAPWIDERDEELVLEVLRSGQLSLGPAGPRFEALLAEAVGAPYCAAVSSGTAGLHLCMRLAGVGPGDEVITSPYSFVASANCAIYEGATPVFADIDPRHVQPRPGGGRGGDHPEDEGDRRGRHLRLPVRARRAARDLRPARARARRGRLRGARRALQGPPARLARPSRRLRLLPEQAGHDRRGRRGHDRIGAASTSCSSRSATRAASRPRAGCSTAGSASTTGSTTSRRRSGSASSSGSTGSSTARREVAERYGAAARGDRASRRRSPTTPTMSAPGSSTSSSFRRVSTATA